MTYRVACDIEGTALVGMDRKAFYPHLVCNWTLDPASHRLSCAWTKPVEGSAVASRSFRIAAVRLNA
jgi:hypothetical protein